jgi:hypothetical protein
MTPETPSPSAAPATEPTPRDLDVLREMAAAPPVEGRDYTVMPPSPSPGATAPLTDAQLVDWGGIAEVMSEYAAGYAGRLAREAVPALITELRSLRRLRADEEGREAGIKEAAKVADRERDRCESERVAQEDGSVEEHGWVMARMTAAIVAANIRETVAPRGSAPTLATCANPYHADGGCFGRENECYDLRALSPSPSLPSAPLPDGRDATRGATLDLLVDVWVQFAYPARDHAPAMHDGGLSVLEEVAGVLLAAGRLRSAGVEGKDWYVLVPAPCATDDNGKETTR